MHRGLRKKIINEIDIIVCAWGGGGRRFRGGGTQIQGRMAKIRCVVSMQNLHNYMNPIKHAFERTKNKKKDKIKNEYQNQFFHLFQAKINIFICKKNTTCSHADQNRNKNGNKKKSKKSDM